MDIWSLGIVILEMIDGYPPNHHSALAAMFSVGIGEVPTARNASKFSKEFHAFMSLLLVTVLTNRASAKELLKDPWIGRAEPTKGMDVLFKNIFVEKSLEALLV